MYPQVFITLAFMAYGALWLWLSVACPYAAWKDIGVDAEWCESWESSSSCVRQPWNSVSNLAFLIVAAVIAWHLPTLDDGKNETEDEGLGGSPTRAPPLSCRWLYMENGFLSLSLINVTFASTLFHASGGGMPPFGMMDVASVILTLWTLLAMVWRAFCEPVPEEENTGRHAWWFLGYEVCGVVFAYTFYGHPWIKWFGWHVLLWIYLSIMIVLALAVALLVGRKRTRTLIVALVLGYTALAGVILLNLSGYDGDSYGLTHCALGNMGHGWMHVLEAFSVSIVWFITNEASSSSN